ncbi:hypothetical protein N7474_004517 [Penicillium riverlandense]|uniref:uncharacterized protein n=1 Tax=Penicillium riverlandense TaxID=1903569 RepID=UPI0025487949|nr:uncharacterized protein N7474_004517 [Penicillium riverlandense]KAJ5818926.1 hypothetical protein N7474_004517 [Penicillium riverlandense]
MSAQGYYNQQPQYPPQAHGVTDTLLSKGTLLSSRVTIMGRLPNSPRSRWPMRPFSISKSRVVVARDVSVLAWLPCAAASFARRDASAVPTASSVARCAKLDDS